MNIFSRFINSFKQPAKMDAKKSNAFFTKHIITNKNYSIGDYTYGHPSVLFEDGKTKLTIGKFCSIADGVTIMLGGNHRMDWVSTYPFNIIFKPEGSSITGHPSTKGDVIIGHDVWLGMNCFILSGIEIGTGAVIAANSVVTKNVKPYEIVAGNPAKHIKFRFSEKEISDLLKTEWWNLPTPSIRKIIPYICNGDIITFCAEVEKLKYSLVH